jgi:addiction module RelE/StbE family toxin
MVEIRLAESAWLDLDQITDYIALDSPRYAIEFTDRILERLEVLKKFKESGRIVPEFQNESLRELILGNYRIVYRIYSDKLVVVLRIIHGSKLLDV